MNVIRDGEIRKRRVVSLALCLLLVAVLESPLPPICLVQRRLFDLVDDQRSIGLRLEALPYLLNRSNEIDGQRELTPGALDVHQPHGVRTLLLAVKNKAVLALLSLLLKDLDLVT